MDDVYLILMKDQSHAQLPTMIVLLLRLYPELPDISEKKVANAVTHSLRQPEKPLDEEHRLHRLSQKISIVTAC